jgi:ABC-type polar amino acid transport system ATPase subunit
MEDQGDAADTWKIYNFYVLQNIKLDVTRRERIVICGPSGSRKSKPVDHYRLCQTIRAGP